MKNKIMEIIIKILYVLSIFGYLTFLFTKNSAFMFCGGLFMIVASIMLLVYNKLKEKKNN